MTDTRKQDFASCSHAEITNDILRRIKHIREIKRVLPRLEDAPGVRAMLHLRIINYKDE